MSQYPPTPPPQPQPGGWDANAGWAPAPPAPDQGWTPPPQPAAPAGWQTQPGGYGTPPPGMPGGMPVKQGRGPAIWIALAAVIIAAGAGAYFVFLSGGSAGAEPDDVVRRYYNAAVDHDCDKMLDDVDLAASSVDRQTALGLCQSAYSEGAGDVPTKLNSISVSSKNASTAVVSVSYESADGPQTKDVNLNKVDGDWKIDLGTLGGGDRSSTTTEGQSTTTTEETTTTEATTTTTETTGSTETPSGSLTPPPDSEEMSDPHLAELANACGGGNMSSCDKLFWDSPPDGDLEAYSQTCGGLVPEAGASDQCVQRFGETVAAG